jgi:chaperonin GroES
MKKIVPLNSRVVVKIDRRNKEKQTQSGIIISAPEFEGLPEAGEVIAIGKDVKEVKVGDRVIFHEVNPHGFKLETNGDHHLCIDEDQILGVLYE